MGNRYRMISNSDASNSLPEWFYLKWQSIIDFSNSAWVSYDQHKMSHTYNDLATDVQKIIKNTSFNDVNLVFFNDVAPGDEPQVIYISVTQDEIKELHSVEWVEI